MRRSTLLISLVTALMLAACGFASPATTTPNGSSPTTAALEIDLSDPDLLARLGSPPFEDVAWKRTVGGLTLLGATKSADPAELELLAGALAEVPPALLDVGPPRNLIRIESVGGEEAIGKAVAFTKGPDIYLVDRTFELNGDLTTRMELARALIHELAHVAQYRSLEDAYVQAALTGGVDQVDPATGSTLVRSFAASVGWIDQSADPLEASWFLPDSIKASSDYGRTGAGEDMAEAVSMVALGRSNWIPAAHTRWVEQWLGSGATTLASGKPWAPAGSREVISGDLLYDEAGLAGNMIRFDHVEPLYFSLPEGAAAHVQLAAEIQQRLLERRLSGVLSLTDDARLPRYAGLFTGINSVSLWVELWDFREATGFKTADPILTYVVLW
ncbi:MAG: hypothetical protein ACXWH0_05820 [Acidimicrobiia bacterium]